MRPSGSALESDATDDVRCYCFGITVDDLRRDGDRCLAFVKAKIRSGDCDCSRLNPSGRCCLGDLQAEVRQQADGDGNTG